MNKFRRILCVVAILLLGLYHIAIPVVALAANGTSSDDNRWTINDFYNENDINFYSKCSDADSSNGDGADGGDPSKISGEGADKVFKYLTTTSFKGNSNKPMNAVQAAAVIGNFQSESGVNPKSNNGSYAGIAQWDVGGRYSRIEEPRDSLDNQLKFIKTEVDGLYLNALHEFWSITSPSDLEKATFAWARNYEVAIQNEGGPTTWTNSSNARLYIQSFDTGDDGSQNPRYPNAKNAYAKYKDQVTTAPNSTSSDVSQKIIWVGDSRTVGMKNSGVFSSNDDVVAESGKGYDWFVSTAIKQTSDKLQDKDNIVFNMGVNDVGSTEETGKAAADKYADQLNKLADGDWKKAGQIIIMSVNPVQDGKNNARNVAIEAFNKEIKSKATASKIRFVDTYSQLKNEDLGYDSEGLHYNAATYKKIYEIIRNSLGTSSGTENKCSTSDNNSNPNIDGYVFPFTVGQGGTTKQSDLTSWYGTAPSGPTKAGGDLCDASLADQGHCHHGPFPDGAIDLTVRDSYSQGVNYQPKGESYLAIYSGTIISISVRRGHSQCNDITLKGDDGWVYWYGHGSNWASQHLQVGQTVKAGDKINEMGVSQCADDTSPHEHIDRGSPKGYTGGIEGHRDTEMPHLMNKLFKTLPE